MKKFLLATVSMVALAGVARGADMPAMPVKGPIYSPVPATDWSGLYLGVQGGVVRRDTLAEGDVTRAGSKTGGSAGVSPGYNWQQGGFVYGLEGDWNWIGAKASSTVVTNFASYDVNWLASVRGRTGIALDATLFYLTGGVAFGQVQNNFAFLDTANVVRTSFPQDLEHVFAPNWTARAEFRYTDLGKGSAGCVAGVDICSTNSRLNYSDSLVLVLVGVSYKFGARPADRAQARAAAPISLSWEGGYLGVQGGVAHHDAFFADDGGFFTSGLIERKKTGGIAGGLIGYNWQVLHLRTRKRLELAWR